MKKAFSLIELLIVILITGIIYTLSVGNFKKIEDNSNQLTLQNLKEYLQSFHYEKNVELLCLDDCSRCDILVDGEKSKEIDDFLDKSIKIYKYDFYNGIQEQSKKVYFNSDNIQKDVCFSYTIDKNGVGDQIIVAYKDRVYDFSIYLEKTPIYNSLEDVVQIKEKLIQEVLK